MSAICMKTTTSFRLILSGVGIFLLLTCVDGTVVRRPQNTAQILGQRVVLDCECDHPIKDILTWGYSNVSEGDVWYNIALCQEGETPSPGYSLNMSKLNSCDLIIERVTAEQAGRYRCSESIGGSEPADSHLIVLATEPLCTTAPSDFINVTDMVTLSCSVKCSGTSDVDPVMTWFDSSGQQLSARNIGSDLSPNYISNVTATIPIVEQYTCETSFMSVPSTGTSGSADNKPTYTSTCYTQPLTVWYPPFKENISIEYEGSTDQYVGSLVFCTGHSVPPVNLFEWRLDDEIKSNDSTLSLDDVGDNLTYTCTVWNQVGSNSDQVTFNVIPVPVPESTTTTTATGPSGSTLSSSTTTLGGSSSLSPGLPGGAGENDVGLIVGAVLGSLSAVALIITLFICICKESCPIYKTFHKTNKGKYEENANGIHAQVSSGSGSEEQFDSSHHQIIASGGSAYVNYITVQYDASLVHRKKARIPYYDDDDNEIDYDSDEEVVISGVRQV